MSQNFVGSGAITQIFPPGQSQGVSSIHVMEGTWELLTKDGSRIVVNKETQFGPGFQSDMPFPSDKVYSIEHVD